MRLTESPSPPQPGPAGALTAPALVVTSALAGEPPAGQLGGESYAHAFALRRFAPLLRRLGAVTERTRPESRLDYALWKLKARGVAALHLSFCPLHALYPTRHAPNVAYVLWDYPDVPDRDLGDNPRANWARVAGRLDRILTPGESTRAAFLRAGVATPVEVVPVPVGPELFAVPEWRPGQRVALPVHNYVFPVTGPAQPAGSAGGRDAPRAWGPYHLARAVWRGCLRPLAPEALARCVRRGAKAVRRARGLPEPEEEVPIPYPARPVLDLSGVVYTTVLNPDDPRKNWQDLLTAFLVALGDRPDATLVVKLAVPARRGPLAVRALGDFLAATGLPHSCKVVLVSDYLADDLLVDLVRATTFYVTATRAEGACPPLQDALAAGRPAVAPCHTGLRECFDGALGWVVRSSPEPAPFPADPARRLLTRWHRIDWQSLCDALRDSYAVARTRPARYRELARNCRQRLREHACAEQVLPRLRDALAGVLGAPARGDDRSEP